MRIHVWSGWVVGRSGRTPQWTTSCGMTIDGDKPDDVPTHYSADDLQVATCLHCLRAIRDCGLRHLALEARRVERASAAYDSELLRRARRAKALDRKRNR